jgi:hypothetical protein
MVYPDKSNQLLNSMSILTNTVKFIKLKIMDNNLNHAVPGIRQG